MKLVKRIGVAVGILLLVLVLAVAALYPATQIRYRDFFKTAQKEFKIPGLSDGFIPQGLDYAEQSGAFLSCGYMGDKSASKVYVITEDGAKAVSLKNQDGSDYTGHTGGISHYQNNLYITGSDSLDVFPLDKILAGEESVKSTGSVKVGLDPAYCHIQNGYMITGSFYREGNYETPPEQRMTTPAGDNNTAIAAVFRLDEFSPLGIDPIPVGAISTRGLVQGMCFNANGQLVLSTSYATATSRLFFYNMEKATVNADVFTLLDAEVPLIWLDEASLEKTVEAPPMSEEILCKDSRIFIMTESASNKYIFGKFTGAGTLYSIPE